MRVHALRKRKRFTRKYLPEMPSIKHTYNIIYIYVSGRVTDILLYTCSAESRTAAAFINTGRYPVAIKKIKNKQEILFVLVFPAIVSGISMIIAAAAAAVDLRLLQMH